MSELIDLRRRLHQIPEVGLHLPETQAVLLAELEGLDLEITLGKELTSIVAVLRGGKPTEGKRPVVLLRADMDGLPVVEATGLEYASTNGNMHACGHDLHMSILIGAVRELVSRRDELAGDVVFMFQPGEESVDGAGYMLREGVLDAAGVRPDHAYALHVWSDKEPRGRFSTKPDTIMASVDQLDLTYIGRGGHGSMPEGALDPIPGLANFVTATHAVVTREFGAFEPVVVTVGNLHAGSAPNVIPEDGKLQATLRTWNPESRPKLFERLERLARGIADAYGLECKVEITEQYPMTINDPEETEFVASTLTDLFGDDRHVRWDNPLGGAEDFSRVLLEVPGSYFGLGACPPDVDYRTAPPNHSAYAKFDDAVLADGARAFAELALRRLAQ